MVVEKNKRPSPSESATKYNLGFTKRGNDGNLWIIVEDKNGINRWKKMTIDKKYKSGKKPGFLSTLESYDVKHITEKKFKNIYKKADINIKNTITQLYNMIIEIRKTCKLAHIIPLPLSSKNLY